MEGAKRYRFWGSLYGFEIVNELVIYRYMRLDIYLCLVALFFLGVGLTMARRKSGALQPGLVSATPDATALPDVGVEVLQSLSVKEWKILELVAEGKTNKEIAATQFVEVSTVKTHLNNIYGKLSVSNRKEARVKYSELAPKWRVGG
jgi:DNA-binding CsgD family transcriptional regulator